MKYTARIWVDVEGATEDQAFGQAVALANLVNGTVYQDEMYETVEDDES